MKLKEYIKWTKTLNEYRDSTNLSDPSAWGYEIIPGSTRIPKFDIKNITAGDEGYDSVRNERVTQWARITYPFLQCVDAKIQIQRPGSICKPHLDFLGDYLESVCETLPGMLNVEHTLEKPGIDVWRMFVAVEDHVEGQIFSINDEHWKWTKGQCIRLNNWQALHWTQNKSDRDRLLIKVTGIKT